MLLKFITWWLDRKTKRMDVEIKELENEIFEILNKRNHGK